VLLTLAYSPCPNDTYIFAALTNGLLPNAPPVRAELLDIDELNAGAARGAYDLVKVSYGAVPYLTDRYRLLRSGGALGRGCGPLVVAKPGGVPPLFADLADCTVAIPGERTTAFLLLQLALGRRPKTKIMRFDRIVDAVVNGEVDAGLIIHESRFTYREANLISVTDLGEWWEDATLLPIPLGCLLPFARACNTRANTKTSSCHTCASTPSRWTSRSCARTSICTSMSSAMTSEP
jgi:1,4-dihydroxy-6-naphthoate synthase